DATVTGVQTCALPIFGGDGVPRVVHREEALLAPGDVLVRVVRAAGVAAGAERDDPAALVPVRAIEAVAVDGHAGDREIVPTVVEIGRASCRERGEITG